LQEIKHDGFRIIARKNGARVRLYSRPGPKDGGRDVFVHISAVERAGARF